MERARGVARTAEVAHFDPAVALRADWEGLEVALVLRFRWKVLVRVSRDRGRKIEPMRSNRAHQPCRSRLALPIGTQLTPHVPLRLQIDRISQVVAWLATQLSSFGHGVVGRGRVGGVPEDARDALLVAALRFR